MVFIRALVLLGLHLVPLLGASCTYKPNQSTAPDLVEEASHLIDQGREDEAIARLEPALASQPLNLRYRTTLASAYGSRAGISLVGMAPFMKALDEHLKQPPGLQNKSLNRFLDWLQSRAQDENSKQAVAVASSLYRGLVQADQIVSLFDQIPLPKEGGKKDLIKALDLMVQGGALREGPSLYRAILRLVLLKSHWSRSHFLPSLQKCVVDRDELRSDLKDLHGTLKGILVDVQNGMSRLSQQGSLNSKIEDLNSVFLRIDHDIRRSPELSIDVQKLTGGELGACES